SLLLKTYILHVGLFTSTCASAATDVMHVAVATSLWLTLITIPPVLLYTVLVHNSCRALDPAAHTAGLLKVILFTILLTPYESSLVLPAKNLWISRRIVRARDGPANNVGKRRGGRVCRSR
ncbi:MAG: hypothetical protein WBQ57_13395, partial [Rhodanobacteraceae bacterium]